MTFPAVVDNTIRKAFVSCPEQWHKRFVQNLRPVGPPSVDLHFGSCFAKAMESGRKMFYQLQYSAELAVEGAVEAGMLAWGDFDSGVSLKSLARLIGAIRFYFQQWPLGEDGLTPVEDGIECRFAIDLPITHPDTGLPIQYAGRYDMLATGENGRLYVVDEKTTSRLGDNWWLQWDLDSQMTGYIWSVRENGKLDPDAEVMAQIRGISILKNEYGHAEVPIIRSTHMINQWYNQLLQDVNRMVLQYRFGSYDKALSSACSDYNRPCDYAKLCKSADPDRLLDQYQIVVWNPLEKK